MDVHAIYQVVINAAVQLGPAGAAAAVLAGGAKAAGGAAFNGIKDWCVAKFGKENEVPQALLGLEAQPDNPAAQAALLKALENNAAALASPEIIGKVAELQRLTGAPGGISVGAQFAEEIINATHIGSLTIDRRRQP